MRRLSAALLLPLLAVPAFAQGFRGQSAATVALSLSATGAETSAPGKNATTIRRAELETIRLGNRDILEDMRADGLITTPSIRGWILVGIWADWPDADPYAGNGYRFFARRGNGSSAQIVAVPSSYLSLKPVKATIGYVFSTSGETITGGGEKFAVYSELGFGIDGRVGTLTGVHVGSGRYVRPAGSEVTYYLPRESKIAVHGTFENAGETGSGVVLGGVSFRPASLETAANTTGSSASAGTVTAGSGTLIIGGSSGTTGGTLTGGTLSGPVSINLGTTSAGTLTLNSAVSFVFSPLPASTTSLTTTLAFARAGTLTLGTAETLPLLAGDTLPLNTLSLAQLSPLTWTPAP